MMETIEYRFEDKTLWPRGLWDDEPDKIQFPDAATGLPCIVRRGTSGAWCGYVGIDPQYEDKIDFDALRVHGGITFRDLCDGDEEHGICHIPGPGEPDPAFWIGFDCAHGGDYAPRLTHWDRSDVYRNLAYVRKECAKLAAQIQIMLQA